MFGTTTIGDGTFTDVSQKAGVAGRRHTLNTGCSLSITIATAISTCSSPTNSTWTWPQRPCRNRAVSYKGVLVACGPPVCRGGKNFLLSQ